MILPVMLLELNEHVLEEVVASVEQRSEFSQLFSFAPMRL